MAKQKIFHIIQSLSNGGCENMLLRTLPHLNNFEHKIITLKELGELASKFTSVGIAVETIQCSNLLGIFDIIRFRRLIQIEKPDIIITYLFHADMLGRIALRNLTKAPIIPFLRTTYNHPKYLIARILEWLTKPIVSRYLANSEAVKNFYIKRIGVRPKKITVISNGIDVEYLDSVIPDIELKKSLGIQEDDFVIICVANLHQNKAHRYLLEAFESLFCHSREGGNPKDIKNIKLLIVGDGFERENLERQTNTYKSKNNVYFLGKRTDIPNLLKISNIFVLPTLFEGMSNAIMEAMATGTPVITTNIPENRELITHNVTGILCPIKDSACMADEMHRLMNDTAIAEQLAISAKQYMRKKYNLRNVCQQWVSFLDDIISAL